MTVFTARLASTTRYELAEGIILDAATGRLRWVDIWRGDVLSGVLHSGRMEDIQSYQLGQTAGAVAVAIDGGQLVAASRGLATISRDGTLSFGPDLLGPRSGARLNDGSVDPQGRFVVGSASLGAQTGDEVLLRVSPDGRVETIRDRIQLSNGIAFSPDGATIYHVDTLANTVSSHSYGAGTFDTDEAWRVVVDSLPHYPDGLTVSVDGSLWIAQWGGACVQHHARTGELLDVVLVDAKNVSCAAFVGRNRDILAITTALDGLETWDDQSGAIFVAEVGATGLPAPRWSGSTTTPYWHREKEATR